jgi:hypothetical protein
MDKDIVPELLANIEQEFDLRTFDSLKLKTAIRQLRDKTATYRDVNEFAIEVGEILAGTLKGHVTADTLPDGKMYYNIAERILNPTMQKNYDLISNFAADVQTELNHKAGLHLKGQKPLLNKDRINGIVNRVSNEDDFSKIKWILDEPIVNFSQSIVDDAIKANADFHLRAGLSPGIERIATGNPCDWCKAVEGVYAYPDVPKDVFRRHGYCRCNVDYDPKSGRRQNVWSKKWKDKERYDKIEARKELHRKSTDMRGAIRAISDKRFDQLTVEAKKNGATIIRGGEWAITHLDSVNAAASSLNDWLIFRDTVTVSEVLEETYHFSQNVQNLNIDKGHKLRTILNEIDAKEYLLKNASKYNIPRSETEETQRHLADYKKALEKWKGENSSG